MVLPMIVDCSEQILPDSVGLEMFEKAHSTILSLSADSMNNTLLILSSAWGKGYLGLKSTLKLSFDPTALGRLVNLDTDLLG